MSYLTKVCWSRTPQKFHTKKQRIQRKQRNDLTIIFYSLFPLSLRVKRVIMFFLLLPVRKLLRYRQLSDRCSSLQSIRIPYH